MIIKAKPFPSIIIRAAYSLLRVMFKLSFNKLVIRNVDIRPNHSYLLMCNHFSFLDGFLAIYLSLKTIGKKQKIKGIYLMVLKKQMKMNPWMKYFGCFSVSPGTASVSKSLDYAAILLDTPGNIVVVFPQGNLESNHVRKILMKEGVYHIAKQININCQLLWSSNLVEYFEGLRPSIYFDMLDCGTNQQFDFQELEEKVNIHHKAALKRLIRFTEE